MIENHGHMTEITVGQVNGSKNESLASGYGLCTGHGMTGLP
jgi:hypothetical protein